MILVSSFLLAQIKVFGLNIDRLLKIATGICNSMQICLNMFKHLFLCCLSFQEVIPVFTHTLQEYIHLCKEPQAQEVMVSYFAHYGFSCTYWYRFKFSLQAHAQCLSPFVQFMKDLFNNHITQLNRHLNYQKYLFFLNCKPLV